MNKFYYNGFGIYGLQLYRNFVIATIWDEDENSFWIRIFDSIGNNIFEWYDDENPLNTVLEPMKLAGRRLVDQHIEYWNK